ncbi:MAG: type II/IV secretion system protein [Candidatus Eremiobacteraeota bacterium]|nr:type II/IV secretion system protein [Candidatus Eremiobacteraeota bacterium]
MSHWIEHLKDIPPELIDEVGSQPNDLEQVNLLKSSGLVTAEQILEAKSEAFQLPVLSLAGYHVSPKALSMLSEEQARKFNILPLFSRGNLLFVAIDDPLDLPREDFLRKLTGKRIKAVLADAADISANITRSYLSKKSQIRELPDQDRETRSQEYVQVADLVEETSPIIKEVHNFLSRAIRMNASDIHLEPDQDEVFLRYRIDGILHEFGGPEPANYPSLVSRIKIMSGLDIAERRLPQDGRSRVEVDGKEFDLRINILPNVHGEGVCIRILNPESTKLKLSEMGFEPGLLSRFQESIEKPNGIILVTGPTGSGKSTTLYATLQQIATRERKLITLEDPVEYKIAGLVQIAIKPSIGFTFGMGLKAILRHDPDVVMLGEIRDLESAEIAFQAALTGHLLFSTLHTNSAALAVTRLLDMGVQKFQVMAALSGVMAQRLLRKLCPECKAPRTLSLREIRGMGLDEERLHYKVYHPKGCAECQQIGYKGRIAVHEFLQITDSMRTLPETELTEANLVELARETGFQTMREVAIKRMLEGVTSFAEVIGVT